VYAGGDGEELREKSLTCLDKTLYPQFWNIADKLSQEVWSIRS